MYHTMMCCRPRAILIFIVIFVDKFVKHETKEVMPTIETVNTTRSDIDLYHFCEGSQRCLPKCCDLNRYFNGTICKKNRKRWSRSKIFLDFADVTVYDKSLKTTGKSAKQVFSLWPRKWDRDEGFKIKSFDYSLVGHIYSLTEEGILYQQAPNEFPQWYQHTETYCVEYLYLHGVMAAPEPRFWSLLKNTNRGNEDFLSAGLLISTLCLGLVLAVYILLPELHNLGGLVLMAYVTCLMVAFLLLAVIKLSQYSKTTCCCLSYSITYFLIASFSWMNVMSCDIWWTFRGYAKARPIHRRGERFKFLMYCVYAFGLPIVPTVCMITFDHMDMTPWKWFVIPNIPKMGCFVSAGARLFYVYTPMMALILCNWVLFLMTAFNVWRLQRGTGVLERCSAAGTPAAHRTQHYRFMVYLKLSVIMGINWALEVISSFKPTFTFWYITDAYNVLIGLSIFLIFVCKKKIFLKVIKRIRELSGWRPSIYTRSRVSSNTSDSELSQDPPVQVCDNPKGPVLLRHTMKLSS